MTDAPANRLIHETSPYLLQHAYNPVDWRPWGDEAVAASVAEDRPILLSVGYAACHWCHVMEHESFADEDIARVMNEHFICIKVDREERPDIDALYMMAVQMMTGQGGWPMTVFLTPDLEPFYAGTYFPPDDRYGRPGFGRLVESMSEYYHSSKDDLTTRTAQVTKALRDAAELTSSGETLGDSVLKQGFNQLAGRYDRRYGGFGTAPKFPQPSILEYLLRYHARTDDEAALRMVSTTLSQMSMGGLYDHVGGGFHRYSTDERWLVPHFEKMLYDNGLISTILLASYALTGDESHASSARGTLEYLVRDMQAPEGGIYSTEDADSEGVEGKYYVWSADEIREIVGAEDASTFAAYFCVRESGNWEETNILHLTQDIDEAAEEHGVSAGALGKLATQGLQKLYAARQERIRPALDDKVLSGWNGLAISALARGGAVLDEPKFLDAARNAAGFVLDSMVVDGRLLRSYRAGQAKIDGFLEDYAYFAKGLLDLHQATQEGRWGAAAERLTRMMIELFWDDGGGAFYTTSERHERLIARLKDSHDGATPSGNAVAVGILQRLAALTGDAQFQSYADRTLDAFSGQVVAQPSAFTEMLLGLDTQLYPARQIVIVGDAADEALQAGLRAAHGRYLPGVALLVHDPSGPQEWLADSPLIAGKEAVDGRATFYVCRDFICDAPTTDLGTFVRSLDD